jgi:hypothetical protein
VSRSGYSDDCEQWELILWRGAVNSALRGKRGQAFLREMLAALDALPEKRLIENELEDNSGAVCALGSVGKQRGLAQRGINLDDDWDSGRQIAAKMFGIAPAMAAEIMFINDDCSSPEQRWKIVRAWVVEQLKAKP